MKCTEPRYIVLKKTDVDKLPIVWWDTLRMCLIELGRIRESEGKSPLEALVIEKDWPEYEPTLELLSKRVDGTQATQEGL